MTFDIYGHLFPSEASRDELTAAVRRFACLKVRYVDLVWPINASRVPAIYRKTELASAAAADVPALPAKGRVSVEGVQRWRGSLICNGKSLFLCTLSVILTWDQVLIAKQSVTTVSTVACKQNYSCLNRAGF